MENLKRKILDDETKETRRILESLVREGAVINNGEVRISFESGKFKIEDRAKGNFWTFSSFDSVMDFIKKGESK